jgi:hypothetical protein
MVSVVKELANNKHVYLIKSHYAALQIIVKIIVKIFTVATMNVRVKINVICVNLALNVKVISIIDNIAVKVTVREHQAVILLLLVSNQQTV